MNQQVNTFCERKQNYSEQFKKTIFNTQKYEKN